MKITRYHTFETNSSSSHSLTLNKLVNQMDNYEKSVCLHYDQLNLDFPYFKKQLEEQGIFYGHIREIDSEFVAHNFAQKIDYLITYFAELVKGDVFIKYTAIKDKINEEKSKAKANNMPFNQHNLNIPLVDLGNVYKYDLLNKRTVFNNETYKNLFIQEIYNHPLFKNLFEVFHELTGKKLYVNFYFGDCLKDQSDEWLNLNHKSNLRFTSPFHSINNQKDQEQKSLNQDNERTKQDNVLPQVKLKNQHTKHLTHLQNQMIKENKDDYVFNEYDSFGFDDENRNSHLVYSLLYSKDLLKIVLCSSENYLKYS